MWYVYVLKSLKDGRHYIGSTSDLDKRVLRHNRGGNISTRNRRPFELIYFEQYNTKVEVMKRERVIKAYKGGNEFMRLLKK